MTHYSVWPAKCTDSEKRMAMVTTATATTTMIADSINRGCASADKTNEGGESFAKSFGKEAEKVFGEIPKTESDVQVVGPVPLTSKSRTKAETGSEVGKVVMVKSPTSALPAPGVVETAVNPDAANSSKKVELSAATLTPDLSATPVQQAIPRNAAAPGEVPATAPVAEETQGDRCRAGNGTQALPGVAGESSESGQPSQNGSPHAVDGAQHRQEVNAAQGIERQTGASRGPEAIAEQALTGDAQRVGAKGKTPGKDEPSKKPSDKKDDASVKDPYPVLKTSTPVVAVSLTTQPMKVPVQSKAASSTDPDVAAMPVIREAMNRKSQSEIPVIALPKLPRGARARTDTGDATQGKHDAQPAKVVTGVHSPIAPPLTTSDLIPNAAPDENKGRASTAGTDNGDAVGLKHPPAIALATLPVEPRGIAIAVVNASAPSHVTSTAVLSTAQDGNVFAQASQASGGGVALGNADVAAQHVLDGTHRILQASPTALEVGMPNGTEGWVKIRAEMATGGGVNASLSAGTPSGQEMLHRELPSLTAYLQQERVAVNTVVVHQPAAATFHDLSGRMDGNVGNQAQQRSGQGGESRQRGKAFVLNDRIAPATATSSIEERLPQGQQYAGMNWLSVRV